MKVREVRTVDGGVIREYIPETPADEEEIRRRQRAGTMDAQDAPFGPQLEGTVRRKGRKRPRA